AVIPQFQVDALWPKPLPNNWILGQVAGITVDRFDRIWIVQRPNSLTRRERAAEQNPRPSRCCAAAPPVLVFDQSGNLVRSWGGAASDSRGRETRRVFLTGGTASVGLAGGGRRGGHLLMSPVEGNFVLQTGKPAPDNDNNPPGGLAPPADIAVDTAAKEVFAAD